MQHLQGCRWPFEAITTSKVSGRAECRLQEALARMQHLEGTFKHADAQSQQMQGDVNSLSNLVIEAVQNMQQEKTSIR